MHAVIKRTAVLIEQAKRANAARLRQAPGAEGKKRQVKGG
jgi:hypothetical protein